MRTVVSRWDLPLSGSVPQALIVCERRDFDCVLESENTCNTKLECVADISTIESELVRQNNVNRLLWHQSRSYVTQMLTRDNPWHERRGTEPTKFDRKHLYSVHQRTAGSGS